jgi:hypothetical protein
VPGGRFEIEQVGETRPGTVVMYMRSAAFGELPGGAEWMKLDLSEQVGAQMQSPDPRDQLKMLRSSEDFEKLGTERVRGVPTEHYKATVDQGDEVERLWDEGGDSAADLLETVIEANDGVDTSGSRRGLRATRRSAASRWRSRSRWAPRQPARRCS